MALWWQINFFEKIEFFNSYDGSADKDLFGFGSFNDGGTDEKCKDHEEKVELHSGCLVLNY